MFFLLFFNEPIIHDDDDDARRSIRLNMKEYFALRRGEMDRFSRQMDRRKKDGN